MTFSLLQGPSYAATPASAATSVGLPELYLRYDPTDDQVTDWQELVQSANCKKHNFATGNEITFSFRPKCNSVVFSSDASPNGQANLSHAAAWYPTDGASAGIRFFGLKTWFRYFPSSTNFRIRVQPVYYLSLRQPR